MRLLVGLAFLAICFTVGGVMLEYVVEFWASYLKGTPVDIPFIAAGIGGLFLGWNLAVPATVITWILSFCL